MRYTEALKNTNLQAFLKTISFSEGTNTPDGYRTIFGGTQAHPILFDNGFVDHPRLVQNVNGLKSDAAGRYQFMSFTWDELKQKLGLTDFSPESQDNACCELISERNALNDACEGNFDVAIQKCCTIWASFPDADKNGASHYGGQPSHPLSTLRDFYLSQGGTLNQSA